MTFPKSGTYHATELEVTIQRYALQVKKFELGRESEKKLKKFQKQKLFENP